MSKSSYDEAKLAKLWQQYKEQPTDALKAYFVATYSGIVKTIALQFMRKKPNVLDYDDLIQAGMEGLLQAIDRYDLSTGNKFQTFASWRVNGAILDSINLLDWTPRSVRENIRGVIKSIDTYRENKQNEPTAAEIATARGMDVEEVRVIMNQKDRTHMVHMEQEIMDVVAPMVDNEQDERAVAIRVTLEKYLNPQERAYITLRYYEGYTTQEIQRKMNLKATELKQVKDSSENKLKEHLKGFEIEL